MEEGDRFTARLWAECLARTTPTAFAPLMTWGHTEIIFICPSFWTLPPALGASGCPAVVDNRATPNDEALIRSMLGVVLHTLVNVYVPASLNYGNSPAQEVVNVQDAIELNTTQSLVNANNYALYAACEFFMARFSFPPPVFFGCLPSSLYPSLLSSRKSF
ncbi:hypothetical protein BDR22DRAFT_846297 [Usnea florida]